MNIIKHFNLVFLFHACFLGGVKYHQLILATVKSYLSSGCFNQYYKFGSGFSSFIFSFYSLESAEIQELRIICLFFLIKKEISIINCHVWQFFVSMLKLKLCFFIYFFKHKTRFWSACSLIIFRPHNIKAVSLLLSMMCS